MRGAVIGVSRFFSVNKLILTAMLVSSSSVAETRQELLSFLKALPGQAKIVSGQHTIMNDGAGGFYCQTANQTGCYRNSIQEINDKTNPKINVGIISADLGIYLQGYHEMGWFHTYDGFFNQLKAYHDLGGIVDLSSHIGNPAGGEYNIVLADQTVVTNRSKNPTAYDTHQLRLKQHADYLTKFRDANIAVLWRPFHEMNGDWFWWGDRTPTQNGWASAYKAMWIQMHDYFTKERGLTNLIWVYSPDGQTRPENALKGYPGDQYVDVVGIDFYNKFSLSDKRALALTAWNLLKTKNKPMAITEMGPFTYGTPEQNQNGTYDFLNDFLFPVREYFPEATYFVPWYNPWCPVDNVNYNALYQHPGVLNRGEFTVGTALSDTKLLSIRQSGSGRAVLTRNNSGKMTILYSLSYTATSVTIALYTISGKELVSIALDPQQGQHSTLINRPLLPMAAVLAVFTIDGKSSGSHIVAATLSK